MLPLIETRMDIMGLLYPEENLFQDCSYKTDTCMITCKISSLLDWNKERINVSTCYVSVERNGTM